MDELTMQAFTIGGLFTLEFSQSPFGLPLTVGFHPYVLTFLNYAIGVVVVGVIRSLLAISLALQQANVAVLSFELSAEQDQHGLDGGNDGNGRRTNIQANHTCPDRMF